MKKHIITGVLILAAAVGVYFLLRKQGAVSSLGNLSGSCYDVPSSMKTWNNAGIEWGAVANGIREIGINNSEDGDYVLGFLKGLNVAADPSYVKYYRKEIQSHLNSSKKLPHWLVTAGQYRCDAGLEI
jgi:hypothetical protein